MRAVDDIRNEKIVERTWTIDTAVPDTTLPGGPAEGSTESGAAFGCRLDGAALAPALRLTLLTDGRGKPPAGF